jgi:hypothetical protein
MAYIVSVRARYCQILRFKARSNDGPGFGRRSSILDERLCPLGASPVPCRVRCDELTPEARQAPRGATLSFPSELLPGFVDEWLGVQFIRDQAPLWLFGLTPQSPPPSGSSETASLMLDAKTLGAALAGAKRTGHQNGVPRQPSSSRPS